MTVEKLQERFHGIEVYDATVTVRKDATGNLTGDASGTLIQEIDKDIGDIEPKLSNKETLKIVITEENDDANVIRNIQIKTRIYLDDNDRAHLVNIVSYVVNDRKRPFYIIDLQNGAVLNHWQGLTTSPCPNKEKYHATGGNRKMGEITYGEMTPFCLSPTIKDGVCYLENEYVHVVDLKQTENILKEDTARFDCLKGYKDEVNGAYSQAEDAFFYGTLVVKMFEEWFNTKPLNDRVELKVHYGKNLADAFWDGGNCVFGDGAEDFYPLAVLDVVGHEIGHGVAEQNSALEYKNESGGINEALADIIGETAEAYLNEADFATGRLVTKALKAYIREFENPENDGYSIRTADKMEPNMNPHFSSGVFRRAWYVLIKEQNMEVRDATSVFLHANRVYWHSTSDFYDASCGLLQAAIDLGLPTEPFRAAFRDVKIPVCDVTAHIFTLNSGKRHIDVTVSKRAKPVFKVKTPSRAKWLFVKVHGKSRNKVRINVMKNGWERETGSCTKCGIVVAKGTEVVTLTSPVEPEYYIVLSLTKTVRITRPNTEVKVDLTAYFK